MEIPTPAELFRVPAAPGEPSAAPIMAGFSLPSIGAPIAKVLGEATNPLMMLGTESPFIMITAVVIFDSTELILFYETNA